VKRPLGVSPSRFAERSLRHPGFAHSCILAFALRAALDCKAGSFGPGSPLAYGLRTACPTLRVGLRPGGGAARGVQAGRVHGPRSGLGVAEGPSAPADPSRSITPVRASLLVLDRKGEARRVGERSRSVWPILAQRRDFCRLPSRTARARSPYHPPAVSSPPARVLLTTRGRYPPLARCVGKAGFLGLYSVLRYSRTACFSSSLSMSGKVWPAADLPGLLVSKCRRRSAGGIRSWGMASKVVTSRPTCVGS
jgi:hypothetical protein